MLQNSEFEVIYIETGGNTTKLVFRSKGTGLVVSPPVPITD